MWDGLENFMGGNLWIKCSATFSDEGTRGALIRVGVCPSWILLIEDSTISCEIRFRAHSMFPLRLIHDFSGNTKRLITDDESCQQEQETTKDRPGTIKVSDKKKS